MHPRTRGVRQMWSSGLLRTRGQDHRRGQAVHAQSWDVNLIAAIGGELRTDRETAVKLSSVQSTHATLTSQLNECGFNLDHTRTLKPSLNPQTGLCGCEDDIAGQIHILVPTMLPVHAPADPELHPTFTTAHISCG